VLPFGLSSELMSMMLVISVPSRNQLSRVKTILSPGEGYDGRLEGKVDLLMFTFQTMGYSNVTNKMYLLSKHEDKCETYLGIFSDEHGERLYREMQVIEKRFGKCLNKKCLLNAYGL